MAMKLFDFKLPICDDALIETIGFGNRRQLAMLVSVGKRFEAIIEPPFKLAPFQNQTKPPFKTKPSLVFDVEWSGNHEASEFTQILDKNGEEMKRKTVIVFLTISLQLMVAFIVEAFWLFCPVFTWLK